MLRSFFRSRVWKCETRIRETLDLYLHDTAKAREMRSDGTYHRVKPETGEPLNAQEALLRSAAVK